MNIFCSTCSAFFEPDDKITVVHADSEIDEYHHSDCIDKAANITYEQLLDLFRPRRRDYTSKSKKNKEEYHKCAYEPCQKLTTRRKFCSRECANKGNAHSPTNKNFVNDITPY